MNYSVKIDFNDATCSISGSLKRFTKEGVEFFIDGWIYTEQRKITSEINQELGGVYNIISWDPETKKLRASNDIFGQRPLYIYLGEDYVFLGDNFWDIAQQVNHIEVDISAIEQLQSFRKLVPSWKTPIHNMYRLPAGAHFSYSQDVSEPEIRQIHTLNQRPDPAISLEKAAEQLHQSLKKQFSLIPDLFPKREVWFGNSGGMDSRLIPAYAREAGIDIRGFLVTNKRKFIKNRSVKAAEQIAKLFDFDFIKLPYDFGDSWNRLLRDIYVNPFGPADFHKNPGYERFKGSLILNGGNSFSIANDNNFWRLKEARRNPEMEMVRKYFIRSDVSTEKLNSYVSLMKKQVDEAIPSGDPFSKLRTIHQVFLNQTSPAGGFESMNLAGEFQYIYHPFATKKAIFWPEKLFYNRQVQLALLNQFFPNLLKIPDQNGIIWSKYKKDSRFKSGYRWLGTKLRTNGLDYKNWIQSGWFRNLVKEVEDLTKLTNSTLAEAAIQNVNLYQTSIDRLDMVKFATMIVLLETHNFDFNKNKL